MKKRTSIFYLQLELDMNALNMDTNVQHLLLNFKEGVATHKHEVDAATGRP